MGGVDLKKLPDEGFQLFLTPMINALCFCHAITGEHLIAVHRLRECQHPLPGQ